MSLRRWLGSLDPYRRAKHGFWLFLCASAGVFFLFARLDPLWLGQEEVRRAMLWTPAAGFALGCAFPFRALRKLALAPFLAGAVVGAACAALALRETWDVAPLAALGASLGGAWGLACALAQALPARPAFAWAHAQGEGDALEALLAGAQALGDAWSAPMSASPFGEGQVVRFAGKPGLWIGVEHVGEEGLARATVAWQPSLSLRQALGGRKAQPVDPLEVLARLRDACADLEFGPAFVEEAAPPD